MKKPTQQTMNLVYSFLIFAPVFVQAGNIISTSRMDNDGNGTMVEKIAEPTAASPAPVAQDLTMPTINAPAPRVYNTDPSLRSQNLYGAPTNADTATDYNLDTAPDMDR